MFLDVRSSVVSFIFSSLTFGHFVRAFYVPGYSIRSYRDEENIPLLVNKIYSDHSELQYAYYDLPFVCPPSGTRKHGSSFVSGESLSLNLGEVLRGDRIRNSDFEINMGKDVECQFLCNQDISRADLMRTEQLIENGYVAEWILDNLPGATSFVTVDRKRKYYAAGFKLGYKDFDAGTGNPVYYLNNHFTLVVRWRKAPGRAGDAGKKVVLGFEVYPKSVYGQRRNSTGCPTDVAGDVDPLPLLLPHNVTDMAAKYPDSSYVPKDWYDDMDDDEDARITIPYTYSVYFREQLDVEWANRWDLYFNDQAETTFTHWLAIVNSLIISGILGAVCMIIWIRTAQELKGRADGPLEDARTRIQRGSEKRNLVLLEKPDAQRGEDDMTEDEIFEDVTGWKLLHGDVFRTPAFAGLLAPVLGSGVQLIFMVSGLLLLSCLGVLNPSWRGGFVSVGVGLFVFAGSFSGYFSARVYRTFGGQNLAQNTMLTALLFPGLLFSFLFVLNLFTWAQASSTAIPFSTLMAIICLWLLIQVPLVHLGSHHGFHRTKTWQHPTRTNTVPRPIPPQVWCNRNQVGLALAAGLVPFAVLFIELLFVFKSLYLDKSSYYYVFGFLSIISGLLTVTIAETVIITTYMQLCAENYHWWWQSFIVGGSSAFWIFLYSAWYFTTRLHIEGFVSTLLFFSYSALACAVYGLATGTIGFITAYAFIRRIYGGVKVD